MDLFNAYRTVGKYKISDLCLQSYPCQHYVTNTETGKSGRLFGDEIYCMLRDDGISDEHFDKYAEFIRKRDNPTPEEIAQYEAREKELEEQSKKSEEERVQRNKLTNTYKASSRLDKLKEKNNIKN
jgi:hypothetical protein